ncbi:ROK family protein [Pedobacter heparinus]|uniref:ROK family protein n=1 Tax=Pedobacter heparinus TaxID=984 RepID=UPI00293190A0|nr:ROK family protein [Pedobacter heparinus]
MTTAIGIDLGGTHIKGILLSPAGEVLAHQVQKTEVNKKNDNEDQPWKRIVRQMVSDLKSKSIHPITAIGLAAPGLPNEENSAIRILPERLIGLENFIWSDYLGEENIWVMNDAHAALMAEARFGVGQGVKNIVMLTLGTGVGGGIFINGELHQGNFQMAGHLGHMTLDVDQDDPGITGMPGTLENAIGNASILRRSFGKYTTTKALVEAYKKGDTFATYIWLNSVRKLALGLCSLNNILSPDVIILGGGITKAGRSLYGPLADFISVYEWKSVGKKCPILQANYSDLAGAVGAAGFALTKLKNNVLA